MAFDKEPRSVWVYSPYVPVQVFQFVYVGEPVYIRNLYHLTPDQFPLLSVVLSHVKVGVSKPKTLFGQNGFKDTMFGPTLSNLMVIGAEVVVFQATSLAIKFTS